MHGRQRLFRHSRVAPESTVGRLHYPGTYAAGVYKPSEDVVAGVSAEHESLVNLPNWLPLTFRIDGGDWFDVDSVELLSYRQTFDSRSAVLTRDLRFRDEAGRTTTTVRQSRFAAMHLAHVAALETTILAEDWSGTVRIRSMIDGDVNNSLVERYRDLASNHLRGLTKAALSENSVLLAVETNQSENSDRARRENHGGATMRPRSRRTDSSMRNSPSDEISANWLRANL